MDHLARSQRTSFKKTLHILFPILAHQHHRRYEGAMPHFVFDTLLSAAIFALIGWNVFLLTTHATVEQPSAEITMEAPAESGSGAMVDIVVVLHNSDEALSNASIGLTYPTTFLYSTASQAPVANTTNRWEFNAVAPNEEVRFTVTGQIVGASGSDLSFKTLLAAQAASGTVARFANTTIRVTAPAITVSFSGPSTLASGASATFTAVLKNATNEPLHDASLVLEAPSAFSLTRSTPRASKQFTWDFATLEAGKETTMVVQGTIASANALDTVLTVHAGLRAGTELIPHGTATLPISITSAPSAETVVTQPSPTVQFVTEARYTSASGITVGFGPVPIKVAQTTGFRIFFVLQRPSALYSAAVMTATLPRTVTWLGNTAASAGGAITYDASSRAIRWTVDPVRPSIAILSGGFDVSVTPTKADVGNGVALLSETTLALSGTAPTTMRAPALTTTGTDLGVRGRVVR